MLVPDPLQQLHRPQGLQPLRGELRIADRVEDLREPAPGLQARQIGQGFPQARNSAFAERLQVLRGFRALHEVVAIQLPHQRVQAGRVDRLDGPEVFPQQAHRRVGVGLERAHVAPGRRRVPAETRPQLPGSLPE